LVRPQVNQSRIGESKFILDSTGISKKDRPEEMRFEESDTSKIKCEKKSDGIIECVIKDYKPVTPEAEVAVSVGCID
jgi:hypothetical protein